MRFKQIPVLVGQDYDRTIAIIVEGVLMRYPLCSISITDPIINRDIKVLIYYDVDLYDDDRCRFT